MKLTNRDFANSILIGLVGFGDKLTNLSPLASDGYVWWVNDGKPAWWLKGSAMAADPIADVSQRPIPYEPMYLIVNLGLSENFGAIE